MEIGVGEAKESEQGFGEQFSPSLHPNSNLELSGSPRRTIEFLKGLRTFKEACLVKVFVKKSYLEGLGNRFHK